MEQLVWAGIAVCLSQSALFSGLNLALLGFSRLRLQAEASADNVHAAHVLALREDSNFLLTTVLWGNVAVNCLLTLLSDSVLTGVGAFLFSTVGITAFGEILPQAYFSRNALRLGALLAPVIRFYQVLLWPVAKPSGWLLDRWLGKEGITYLRERDLREVIKLHIRAGEAEVDRVEGVGALNFLTLDDLEVEKEGEPVDQASVIRLPRGADLPLIPDFERTPSDPFLRQVHAPGEKWIVLTDPTDRPQLLLDADGFLRAALLDEGPCNPYAHCHRPIVVEDPHTTLGELLHRLRVQPESNEDDVIDLDVMLLWGRDRRILTGADLLGRLLRGIAIREPEPPPAATPT